MEARRGKEMNRFWEKKERRERKKKDNRKDEIGV